MKLQIKKIKYLSIILFLVFPLTFLSSMPAISKKELESLPDMGSSYKGYIKPNQDFITQWNNADPPYHWDKLDEYPIEGDSGNIQENVVGLCDKWGFTSLTLAYNEYVTTLVYWAYMKEQAVSISTFVDIDSSASTAGYWEPTGDTSNQYHWYSYTKTGLWLSQSELEGFWLQAKVADMPSWMEGYNPGWVDINTVYVDVYVETGPTPPDPPTLYDIPSPNDDGIITLEWTSSSGATSYKVYKSDAEFGTYTLIATTSSLTYTDTVTSGSYWYYVKAHNNDGDSGPSNREGVEVYIYQDTWYESNAEYNIGDFPANEWEPWSPGDDELIEAQWASDYNVDMWGKAIRFYSPNIYHPCGIERSFDEPFTIAPGESLYLKFKAQMNKEYATGEGLIELIDNTYQTFLKISFNSQDERIDIWTVDNQFMQYWDQVLGRVIDFDIVFVKDPDTSILRYLIFIDQNLQFVHEVNTVLYPVASRIKLSMDQVDSGEFFIDNFFFGRVNNSITPEEDVEVAIPMYYMFAPEFYNPYLDSIDLKYEYLQITTETITTSFLMGFAAGYKGFGLSVLSPIQLSQVIHLSETTQYKKSTNGVDLIIFNLIEGKKSDVTIFLPGDDPETDASNITAMYTFDILAQDITCETRYNFETAFGLPDDFDDCKTNVSKVGELLFKAAGGAMGDWAQIEQRQLEISSSYSIGITLGIPLGKYVKFNLGLLFTFSYSYYIETELSMEVAWNNSTPKDEIVQVDLYTPKEKSYSTPLDLPPYYANESEYTPPSVVTGFTATGGQRLVSLSWNPVDDLTFEYYKIYRNGQEISTISNINVNSYVDSGLDPLTDYNYHISVFNTIDEEGPKSSASATTLKDPDAPATPGIYLIMIASFGIVVLLINRKTKKRKIDR